MLSVPSYIRIKDSGMNAFGARNAVLLLIGYRVGAMSWAGSIRRNEENALMSIS